MAPEFQLAQNLGARFVRSAVPRRQSTKAVVGGHRIETWPTVEAPDSFRQLPEDLVQARNWKGSFSQLPRFSSTRNRRSRQHWPPQTSRHLDPCRTKPRRAMQRDGCEDRVNRPDRNSRFYESIPRACSSPAIDRGVPFPLQWQPLRLPSSVTAG